MMDFSKLQASEKKESNSVPCHVALANNKVTLTFDFDASKAKITKKGKEYYINFSGRTKIKLEGRDTDMRVGGNIFIS